MADWISHILLGIIIAEIFNIRKKSLVLLGTILPDIILKNYLLLYFTGIDADSLFWFLYPLHTIVGVALFALLITMLFRYDAKKCFFLLFVGALSHIILDLTTKPIIYNIQGLLLFPLSWRSYNLGLFYSEQYWIVTIIFFAIYITIKQIVRYHKRIRAIGQY